MARVLVTGYQGFLGRHLTALLLRRGDEVIGLGRRPGHVPGVASLVVDLRDAAATREALAGHEADLVIHLAAARTGDLAALYQANVAATEALLEACRRWQRPPRVLLVGSAAQYGALEPGELPVREEQPFRPLGPYGLTKSWAEMLGFQVQRLHGLPVVAARVFNVTGPGEPETTFVGAVVAQLAAAGRVRVGRLEAERDFVDARDAAAALLALAERGRPGRAYNVCSGQSISMRAVLDMLCRLYGGPVEIEAQGQTAERPEVAVVRGDPRRIEREMGWRASRALVDSLRETLAAALAERAAV